MVLKLKSQAFPEIFSNIFYRNNHAPAYNFVTHCNTTTYNSQLKK